MGIPMLRSTCEDSLPRGDSRSAVLYERVGLLLARVVTALQLPRSLATRPEAQDLANWCTPTVIRLAAAKQAVAAVIMLEAVGSVWTTGRREHGPREARLERDHGGTDLQW